MKPQSFIFMGRSGCGKGTQIKLLMESIAKKDYENECLYIYTGQLLRDFIQGQKPTQKTAAEIYNKGGLMPEFLVVHMWVKSLVENYRGKQHLLFDGTPRKLHEAGVLHSVFGFYGIEKKWVINIKVKKEESLKRLLLRKRMDDSEEDILNRLSWYESEVVPTIEYYRNNPEYTLIDVDGEQSVEQVHADIVKKLGLA